MIDHGQYMSVMGAGYSCARLVPGERADFLLVDRDPLLSPPDDIRQTKVIEVWIGGVKVKGD